MANSTSENNKRIAKNTLLLYMRMFVMMFTALFTSRIVLQVLGETDYGIYNIIGGVVVLFSFLNSALLQATQRFLNFNLGKKDEETTHKVFCMSLNSYFILSVIFLILGETIGLWFVDTQLNIPENRMHAAHWVYQFSLLTFVINLIRVPYNATIIAYERMDFYAYLSLGEVVLKLIVVYLLYITTFDKLVFYSFLYTLVPLFITLLYKLYCNRHFPISHYKRFWDKNMFNQLFSFSGWSLLGNLANLAASQGLNILINMFFNPSVNAARGIAYQINNAINQFFTNFFNAVRPQITKYYAQKDLDNLFKLVFRSSKLSFFLIYALALPIIIEAPYIIQLWLGQLPEYVVPFTRLIVIITAVDAMANPLMTSIHATGHIKLYQSLVGTLIILNVPISYIILNFTDSSPIIVFEVSLVINIIALFVRVFLVRSQIKEFPVLEYFKDVIGKSFIVSVLSFLFTYGVTLLLPDNFLRLVIVVLWGIMITLVLFFMICLNKEEQHVMIDFIKKRIRK